MKIAICLFSALFFVLCTIFSPPALAADKPHRALGPNKIPAFPQTPQMISYETMMQLPPKERAQYIWQLRLLLVDLSEMKGANSDKFFAESGATSAEWARLLELFVPQASAAGLDLQKYVCDGAPGEYVGDPENRRVRCKPAGGTPYDMVYDGGWKKTDVAPDGPKQYKLLESNPASNQSNASQANAAASGGASSGAGLKPDVCIDPTSGPTWGNKDPGHCDSFTGDKNKDKKAGETCFFAGNVMSYDSKNRCTKPTKICKETGAPPEKGGSCKGVAWSCKDSSQVICNPVIFGLQSKDEPFCVPPGRGATKACFAKVYKSEGDYSKDNSLQFVDKSALEAGYAKLTEAIGNVCVGAASGETKKDYMTQGNCTACEALRSRLAAINTRVKAAIDGKHNHKMFQSKENSFSGDDPSNQAPECVRTPEAPQNPDQAPQKPYRDPRAGGDAVG